MILNTVLLLMTLVIAYWHFTQGFFSGVISATLAVLAAVLAMAYHETIVMRLLGGSAADIANGMTLTCTFAAIYIVGRIIFDILVPGNVRVQSTLDKVGGGLCGLVAGAFAMGIFAISVQALPWGVYAMGYSRFLTTTTPEVDVPGAGRDVTAGIFDLVDLPEGRLERSVEQGLWIPIDRWVVGLTSHLSNGGSLAGSSRLEESHPDYLLELYAQRLGLQPGSKHTALNTTVRQQIKLDKVFGLDIVPQVDGEIKELNKIRKPRDVSSPLVSTRSQTVFCVRILVDSTAIDESKLFAFSPGSIRLVANSKNYHPVGTLEGGSLNVSNVIDDFLFMEAGTAKKIDLVFVVDNADFSQREHVVDPGVFLEVKRLARVDLSDKEFEMFTGNSDELSQVLRKPQWRTEHKSRLGL